MSTQTSEVEAPTGERALISPSRTYVMACNKTNFDGHYFRLVTLPDGHENNAAEAAWYFLNRVDYVSCVDRVFVAEDFANVRPESRIAWLFIKRGLKTLWIILQERVSEFWNYAR